MLKKLPLAFAFCLSTFSFALAQWSTSPDSALQIGFGEHTEIISDGNGGALVLFHGFENVRVQKLDKYGYIQWTNITPQGGLDVGGSTSDSCWQVANYLHSAIVADGEGGVYVMFDDVCCIANCQGAPQTITQGLIQHFDSLGNWLWSNGLPVSIRNSYETWSGGIVTDGAGGIIALYNERDSFGGPSTLRAQQFGSTGNRLWGNEGVVVKDPGGFRDVGSDGVGGVVINYMSSQNNASILQRFDQNGQILWDSSGVTIPSGAFELAVDPVGEAVYVHNSGGKLRVNKVSLTDGTLQWDSIGVIVDTLPVNSGVHDFKVDLKGSIWILWYYFGTGEAFLQRISPSGNKCFSLPGIPPSPFPSQKGGVKLQPSQDSSMVVIWSDQRNGASNFYGQRVSGNGNYIWQDDSQISTIPGGADLTTDENYGVILSWWRLANFGIYVHQVSRNGNLGEILSSVVPLNYLKLPDNFLLYQNHPNPFNPVTTIAYALPLAAQVELTVFDLLGRQIRTLVNARQPAGDYQAQFNGTDLSSGVYYYRLKIDGEAVRTRKMVLLK